MRLYPAWATAALFALAASASAQFALHDGDRVVFYGDSITDNAPYANFIETFVHTRYPKMNVRFFNAGVGGDRVSGGGLGPIDDRLTRDLFSRKPTVVTVMLGMNDAGYQAFRQDLFDAYQSGYRHIIDRFKAEIPNARVWLIQPSPYDDATRPPNTPGGGYNAVLQKYGSFVADLAKLSGYGTIDLNTPVFEALSRAAAADPVLSQKILADRVHPWIAGQLVMAANILKAWGASSLVSRTDIDAVTGKSNEVGETIRNLKVGGSVRWTSKEESLPFPIDRKDPTTALILRTSPVEDMIGRELVLVHHLPAGNYNLSIDGKVVGNFSAETFDSGVDLSWMDTPMARQALVVNDWTTKRAQLKYFAWRNIEFGMRDISSHSRVEALKAIDRLEDDVVHLQREAAIPVSHRFEVSKS